ncbi:uncharacterized protein ACHE_41239A [Aspergillus chevalieri]|uniref:Uncharacterized protein n=1 Tax=Aspergillus chevalieri TaxID=182096 RepID=A0A7R7VPZ8_ASPCH|nr:uncharacterized protein ACHE_41239A [Aspergillus chevalieri]BCR88675.1 hypothetical protein ACHE_41239A [Aspergillus chevalieri]
MDSSTGLSSTMSSLHNPLAGIPAQPTNSSNINVSLMSPPQSVYYNYYNSASSDLKDLNNVLSHSMHNNTNANANTITNAGSLLDWFTTPLDQGLGGTGPMLREYDILKGVA